eukprot:TRINITY_DN12905_c0_g1_i1.p1 TRINITY_DN12905_c0_g1~~TRINITY_DN12905_c0_g1_i1.p1  ORF type:complete len:931 (+),score=186.08 TRINITY_DN12905_c0_g1_i1:551-3343(+)
MANNPMNPSSGSAAPPPPRTPSPPSAERRSSVPPFSSPLANTSSLSLQTPIPRNPNFNREGSATQSQNPLSPDRFQNIGLSTPPTRSQSLPVQSPLSPEAEKSVTQNGSTSSFSDPSIGFGVPLLHKQNSGAAVPPQFGPAFASPLRPPVLPPFSPQSFSDVPFSPAPRPAVLLPTSSLPSAHSNGTLEPRADQRDVDSSGLVEVSPFVLFSAHKVLKQKKLSNTASLGFGALVSPGSNVIAGPSIVQHNPYRCHNCGAYVNLYCTIVPSSGEWKCVVCKKLNSSEGEYRSASRNELLSWPELSSAVVDYVENDMRRPGFIPVSDSRMSAPIVLVIDESLDEPHLQHLQSSLHAFVDSLPQTTRIGIITYGRTVSVYDFSESPVAFADVLPGSKSPSQESLKTLFFGTGIYLAPLHSSVNTAHTIISSLRPYKDDQPEAGRDRCLGAAVEVALALIQGPAADMSRGIVRRPGGNSRILVCVGGPNTFGPAAVPPSLNHPNYAYLEKKAIKWMDHLGHEAHHHEIVVDIFCAGTCPVRVPILQPLAKASGGVLILHDDFGEAFGVNLQRAARRAAGSHGIFEIRCSDEIYVSRVIGPGEEAHVDTHESFKKDSSTHIQMATVEETQSFAVSMEHGSDIKERYVFFQFVARFSDVYQRNILRVITTRLPTTDSLSAYLESVEGDVTAVLIGKRTVLEAKGPSDVLDMRRAIDERIKDIAVRFGTQMPKTKLRCFPKALFSLPEYLFHLRRGPLLGSIVGHEDERSVLRNLFLQASFDLSFRMLAPRVLMHREGGTFEELPAYNIAMQSDAALVLDHGTDVFIWMGGDLASQERKSASALAACRTLAEELTEHRFPAPRILSFKEGSSQARYLSSRLIPAHKDPPYEQEVRFPQLLTLSTEQRIKLKSNFFHIDDLSFCEWMRSLKLVPPEPR